MSDVYALKDFGENCTKI